MDEEYRLSLDALIKQELDGKATAIARYDEMLWKIRSGYAVLLYGAVGLVVAMVNQETIALTSQTALSASTLIIGFSVFGAVLDYCFISAKLRVVNYRDRLIELVFSRVTGESAAAAASGELLECLKNSGERREHINWGRRVGRSIPLLYYGGTGALCTIATSLLVK